MSAPLRALVAPLLVSALLLPAAPLFAQSVQAPIGTIPAAPPPEAPAGKPVITPPKLKKFVEATYPAEALAQNLTARVEIELIVAATGLVQDAKITTPVGNGFDEAALEAVKQFEFEPATRDGQPIAARIRYPYVFEIKQAPEPEPEPEAPPPPARFEGHVLAAEDGAPLANALVTVTSAGGQVERAEADEQGHFVMPDLTAGEYTVRVEATGELPREQPEELRSGEVTEVTYRLQKPPDTEAFGAVARIQPPPREVTRRTIGKAQLTRIPGTRGDALRTVELMPGVARPPMGAGVLIVRGSAPADTQAMFEGLPVQLLYHFGGLTSFMNSRMIESIDFYPGNFSVRYGRRRGAIIEVGAAEIPRDAFHGVLDLNLIDASVLASTPLSDNAEVAVAFRRSYFDAIFGAVAGSSDDISTVAAPVYYDYQAMATYRPDPQDKLRIMAYGSSDKFALLFKHPSDSDAALTGDFNLGTQFHRIHASWHRAMSSRVDQDIDLAVGYLDADLSFGEAFKFNLKGNDVYERTEWRFRVTDNVRLIAGIDAFFLPGDFTYVGPPVEQTEGNANNNANGSTFSNRDSVTAKDSFLVVQPALYVESDITLGRWLFILGNRADYFSEIHDYTYDPRGALHYQLTDTTTLKGGVGMFAQPPAFQESSPKLGNKNLKATHTLHVDVGVDQMLSSAIKVGLDGFYKHMYDRVVGTAFGEAPFFTNDGDGRVYGLEFSARVEPKGRFFGYLSYTLSRSERRDHDGDPWSLFDFDQTHILTVSAVYRLGRGWEAGATFRLVSGNPETPIAGSSFNAITGEFSPIFGPLNSERSKAFNRLDIRVEKLWQFTGWKLALYLDLQNAYNAANSEGKVYDYEYRQRQNINSLPIIPNLGLRGEL
jgi:TonB family protein